MFKHFRILIKENFFQLFFIIFLLILVTANKRTQKIPLPTEIINKKENKKKFKQERKDWIRNMHKSAPDDDWELINENIRLQKHRYNNQIKSQQQGFDLLAETSHSRQVPGEWNERGSNNQAGRIRTSEYDFISQEIYCASSGGNIWRGSLDGTDWVSLNDYFQIKGIILLKRFSHNETQRMVMINNKNCYYTDDDGYIIESSTGLESVQNWGWIFRGIINTSNNHIFLGAIEWDYELWTYLPAIYKSINGGESFTKILDLTEENGFTVGSSHFDIWMPNNDSSVLFILNDGKIFRYDNDEITLLHTIETSQSGNNILVGGTDQSGSNFLHCRIGNELFSSLDSGNSWLSKGVLPTGTFTINSFECHPNISNRIVIGGVDGYYTINAGDNWQLINNWWEYYSFPETKLHADLPDFSYYVDPDTGEDFQLICTDGGIYISYDEFQNVQNLSMTGLGVSQYYSTYTSRFSPYHIYAGSQDQGFQIHLSEGEYDGVLDFDQIISGDYGHIVSGDSGVSIWTDYPGFVMYYNDIINSENMVSWDFEGSGYLWLPPLMIDPYDNQTVYIGGGGINSQNHMVKVHYGSNGMESEDMSYTFESKISAMAFSPITKNYWYVSTENGEFFYSDDSGQNFISTSSFNGPESHYFYGSSILPSPIDDERIYIAGSGYSNPGIYLSTDGGQTFTPFDNNLPNTLIYDLACLPDESIIFAATEVGPYFYSFLEGEWADLSDNTAPDQTYWTVDYIDDINTVRFGTYGRGIWDYTFEYDPILLFGDINQDSIVNLDDIFHLLSIILAGLEISNYVLNVGNLNHDEYIDIFDILFLTDLIDR